MSRDEQWISRRRFVQASGALTTVAIAGCSGDGGDGEGDGNDGGAGDGGDGGDGTATDGGDGGDGSSEGALEILHGWTGGDGAEAADALEQAFNDAHPDIEAEFNPVGGGGNENLDAVVANRLQEGNPPSSFANWPGPNLRRYEGVLGDVSDVWEEEGFEDAHVDEAVELHQQDGAYRAVPLGSHRLNCLFYNVSVVEEAGVNPDDLTSVDALLDALETVDSETDAVPMTQAMSAPWTVVQLFASTMLGQEGIDAYENFIDGNPDRDAVVATFETLQEIFENYISDDASTLDLTQSNDNIISGEAAFIHQGNWAAGAFRGADDFAYDEDWGFKTFPGTEDMYMLHFDSFLYPADNPTPEASKTWLRFVGNEDAQVAFNQYKGSIPTRTDVDMSEFGPYLQETAEDFENAEHRPPTLYHGLAVEDRVISDLEEVVSSNFMGPYDPEAAADGFVDAVSN